MGKNNSELENFEKDLNQIARDELNQYWESDNKHPEDRSHVLEEHLRNNILIDELYQSIDNKKKESQKFFQLCQDQISSAKKRAKALTYGYPNSPLPEHKGYNKLIKILEENGELPQILDLCLQAKEQGWKGNWDDEIKRVKTLMKHKKKS
jgi:hypothetical protein